MVRFHISMSVAIKSRDDNLALIDIEVRQDVSDLGVRREQVITYTKVEGQVVGQMHIILEEEVRFPRTIMGSVEDPIPTTTQVIP